MSLAQGFPNTFSATQQTQEVLKNTDNETKKIYNDINALMAVGGHAHTGNGSDGALVSDATKLPLTGGTLTGVLNEKTGTAIASTTTLQLTNTTGNLVHITGTTTIKAISLGSGMRREVIFDGVLTLTHHDTNNNLPGGTNITTAVGDRATYWSDGIKQYCTKYQKASGLAVVAPAIASSAQAIAGTDNTTMITPLQVRNALNCTGTAPIFPCRTWVNFNGTGTIAIMASGNVSSITDNGVGDYTVNFTTALPDANYSVNLLCFPVDTGSLYSVSTPSKNNYLKTVSAYRLTCMSLSTSTLADSNDVSFSANR